MAYPTNRSISTTIRKFIAGICLTLVFAGVDDGKIEFDLISKKQLKCLADNIYYEARGEPIEGQLLVGVVTLNRARTAGSICTAVHAPYQFSWTLNKKNKIKYKPSYDIAYDVALRAIYDRRELVYFHTKQITPKWAKNKKRKITIGNHVFY